MTDPRAEVFSFAQKLEKLQQPECIAELPEQTTPASLDQIQIITVIDFPDSD